MIIFISATNIPECFEGGKIQNVLEYCSNKSVLAIDTETDGLDYTGNKITMLQIGDNECQFVIDVRTTDILPLKPLLENKEIIKVLHNAKFDYLFIKSQFGIELNNVYDTMLAEKVITCGKNKRYGLKNLVEQYFNETLDKNIRTTFGVNKPFTKDQIKYGAKDVEYLISIRNRQQPFIEKYKLTNTLELENKAVLAFADIEYNGLDLDKEKWLELNNTNKTKATTLHDNLDQHIINNPQLKKFVPRYVQADLFTTDVRKININWDSPKQVLEVLQCLVPKLENVNAKQMYKYRYRIDLINDYIKYKEAMKLCTSYGEAFFDNFKSDGRIHTSFHQILDTGRVSSSGPNMQQIPADNSFRNCFIAPAGWKFVSADYSSQELNVIAFGSKDPVWIEALEKGQDLHSVCAELVYGEQWYDVAEEDCAYYVNNAKEKCDCKKHKSLRTNVKTINFGLAYGMGPHKLADTLNITMNEAKDLIKQYFNAFPSIGGFLDKLATFGKKYGYIKTFPPYNRRRWFDSWYPKIWNNVESKKELGTIERASKNTPIQGASADMTKLALILIREYINITKCPVKIVMTVHDQIDTICEESYLNKWTDKMQELMELAAKQIVTNGLLKAEVNISDYWQK